MTMIVKAKRGDLVDVTWVDITEDAHGHPSKITPEVLTHTWRFYGSKTFTREGVKIPCTLFTSSKPKDDEYYHAIVIPKAVILSVRPASRR